MELEEYFLAGKMYVFGGFDTYTDEILLKKFGEKPRRELWVEGKNERCHSPKIGDYYMCLEVIRRPIGPKDGSQGYRMSLVRFLSPNNQVVIDTIRQISRRIVERWKFAEEHFEDSEK